MFQSVCDPGIWGQLIKVSGSRPLMRLQSSSQLGLGLPLKVQLEKERSNFQPQSPDNTAPIFP